MTSDGFYTLGVCITSLEQDRYGALLRFLQQEAPKYKVHLLVFSSYHDLTYRDNNDQGEKSIYQLVPYHLLDGVVLFTESFKDLSVPLRLSKEAKAAGCPVISVDTYVEDCINISFSYGEAFRQIVEHIVVHHGCRRINLVAGIQGNPFEQARTKVFREVLAAHGIPVEEERIGYGDFWDRPAYTVVEQFLQSSLPLPEAIICENDYMAIATCSCLKKHGLRVPEDILVTGLDGIELASKHTPRITTAKQDQLGCVQKVLEVFTRLTQGEPVERDYHIPFKPIFDQSCGCLPVSFVEANEVVLASHQRWEAAKTYDLHMDNMQTDVIRLRYRDMLPRLDRYLPNDSLVCLRTDYNSILETPQDYGSYDDDLPAFTPQMNAIVLRRNYKCEYNRFFNSEELLPEFDAQIVAGDGILFVPLHFQEITFGYLAVYLNSKDGDFDMVRRFSRSFGIILQVIQQQEHVRYLNRQMAATNQKLTDLYNLDPLTGILNRRGFHDYFSKYIEEQSILEKQFILFSIDMDGLKTINDTYGHKEGDFSLCMIADAMKHMCRQHEDMTCARFGGDEFIAAGFFDDDPTISTQLETFFRSQMQFLNEVSGKDYKVRVSVGILIQPPGTAFDLEAHINTADTLMYQNKQARKKARHSFAKDNVQS